MTMPGHVRTVDLLKLDRRSVYYSHPLTTSIPLALLTTCWLLSCRVCVDTGYAANPLPWGHFPVRISIIQKNMSVADNRAFIDNGGALAAMLNSEFGAQVSEYGWQGMPIAEQVQRMAQCDIMISLPGGDVINAVFMPTHSAMIIPWRFLNSTGWDPSRELKWWFNLIPSRYIITYNPEYDHETTVDNATGAMKLGLSQMHSHVDEAVRHLAARGSILRSEGASANVPRSGLPLGLPLVASAVGSTAAASTNDAPAATAFSAASPRSPTPSTRAPMLSTAPAMLSTAAAVAPSWAARGRVALVTGITGQDGSYLAELLLNKGYIVHGIIRRSSSFNTHRVHALTTRMPSRLLLHYGDLSDGTALLQIVAAVRPDEVYNLAAQSHVMTSFETSEYTGDVDGLGVLRLLNAIRSVGLTNHTRFYQASTSELFGRVREAPQSETTPFYPRSPYGVAKQYAYWIVVNYREAYVMHA